MSRRRKNPVFASGGFAPAMWGGQLAAMNRGRRRNPVELLPWVIGGAASGVGAMAASRAMARYLPPPRAHNPLGAMLAIVGANPGKGRKRASARPRVVFHPNLQAWSVYVGKRHVLTTRDPERLHYLFGGSNLRDGGRHVFKPRPLGSRKRGYKTPTGRGLARSLDGLSRFEALGGGFPVLGNPFVQWSGHGGKGGGNAYASKAWLSPSLGSWSELKVTRVGRRRRTLEVVDVDKRRNSGQFYSTGYGMPNKPRKKGKAAFASHKRGCTCVYHAALRRKGKRKNPSYPSKPVRLSPLPKKAPKPGTFLPSSIDFNPRTKLGKYLAKKIPKLVREGYKPKQAVAIAYSYARRAGYKVASAPRRAANPGGGKLRKVTVSLERAIQLGMPDFERNAREFMDFFPGVKPRKVTIYAWDDGKKGITKEGGYSQGRAPEVHYLGRGAVKGNTHYVHKTTRGREPILVRVPRTGVTHLVGGAMKVKRDKDGVAWLEH